LPKAPNRARYGAVEAHAVRRGFAAGVGHQHAAGDVFEPRHPQPALVVSGQPAGHADVIGMHVRADHSPHATPLQRAGESTLPVGCRIRSLHAGIGERPAVAVFERPDVDVVQTRHRQSHTQPQHAAPDLLRRAGRRHPLERVAQRRGAGSGIDRELTHDPKCRGSCAEAVVPTSSKAAASRRWP